MTVDTRGMNAMTQPMPFPMLDMEASSMHVEGAEQFFPIDWFRGYWQLPLHEHSQAVYTITTAW